MLTHRSRLAALASALLWLPALAPAQVTLKPDGQWRYLLTAGANISSGNNNAGTLNLLAEGARQTTEDKWTWDAKADRARAGGNDTIERYGLRTQYNRDFGIDAFGFGGAELLSDRFANLDRRSLVAAGLGRHLWRDANGFFDLSAGLAYTQDRFVNPTMVAGAMRSRYDRLELVLAEESSHKLTDTTNWRQKLSLYPDLRDRGKYRAVLDTGLTVAMTQAINLSAGLSVRYDSDPGTNLKKSDAMFVTGISVRLD